MMNLSRPLLIAHIVVVLALAVFPLVGEVFYLKLVTRIMILAIFAMSLDLLMGYTGLVSFGHAAFFGFAGYMLAIVTPQADDISLWLALPVCLAATAAIAAIIGWFTVRTSGIYFIMITLAFAQMLYYFFHDNPRWGGSDGIFINSRPTVSLFGFDLLNLKDKETIYFVVLASLVGSYALLRTLLASPFGQVVKAVRANEHRTRALGFDTQRYKLVSFVIAGTIAGLAGFLEAVMGGMMNPAFLGWHESGFVMVVVILGGMGTLYGPVLGAFALVFLKDWFQDLTEHWQLLMGVFVIAVVLLLPRGLAGLVEDLGKRFGAKPAAAAAEEDEP